MFPATLRKSWAAGFQGPGSHGGQGRLGIGSGPGDGAHLSPKGDDSASGGGAEADRRAAPTRKSQLTRDTAVCWRLQKQSKGGQAPRRSR